MIKVATVWRWLGFGAGQSLADHSGQQSGLPSAPLVEDTRVLSADSALQLSAVWACVDILSKTVATLPLFVYEELGDGLRKLARGTALWGLLHDSPNGRMTPNDFWRAMLLNLALRGNAYARIERDARGEATALWPMHADQVTAEVLSNGSMLYWYYIDGELAVLAEQNVLHLKDMGNGTVGLAKLDYMRPTTSEAANAQNSANKLFANGGKPTGVLMVDNVLSPEQRAAVTKNFADIACGSTSRLFVLEANMKYQQINLSPQDMQLLATRQFSIEEIGRWYGVPAVLINHSNVTTWGSGIEQIVEGFYKFTIRPILVAIEQALRKKVFTVAQRARYIVEFNFEGLLRANIKDRAEVYSKLGQNGAMTRNEMRQLENLPPLPGGDELTVQVNLVPIDLLREVAKQPKQQQNIVQDNKINLFEQWQEQARITKAAADTDRRHNEVLTLLQRLQQQPLPHITVINQPPEQGAPTVNNEFKLDQAPAPSVTVVNQVNPTPINVDVTNEVNPTPVDVQANFEATVQAGEVRLELPPRKTTTEVTRDKDGNIVRATQLETDV
jgi:HK97 family phage portal protein